MHLIKGAVLKIKLTKKGNSFKTFRRETKSKDTGEGPEQHVPGRGETEGRYHAGKRPRVRSQPGLQAGRTLTCVWTQHRRSAAV